MACHTFEQGGGNRVGPNLWDVVGNDIAAAEGFRYSQGAMQDFGTEHGQWSIELLGDYLAAPAGGRAGHQQWPMPACAARRISPRWSPGCGR